MSTQGPRALFVSLIRIFGALYYQYSLKEYNLFTIDILTSDIFIYNKTYKTLLEIYFLQNCRLATLSSLCNTDSGWYWQDKHLEFLSHFLRGYNYYTLYK